VASLPALWWSCGRGCHLSRALHPGSLDPALQHATGHSDGHYLGWRRFRSVFPASSGTGACDRRTMARHLPGSGVGSSVPGSFSAPHLPQPNGRSADRGSRCPLAFHAPPGASDPSLLALFLGNVCIGVFDEAVFQHLVPFANHLGYPETAATSALGLAAILLLVGQIFGGSLSDRVGRERAASAASAFPAAGLLLLLGLAGPTTWALSGL
jgi:predicted MFS family arabinose efflux permease